MLLRTVLLTIPVARAFTTLARVAPLRRTPPRMFHSLTLADIGDELVSKPTTSVQNVDASIYLPIFVGGVAIFIAGVIGAYLAVVRVPRAGLCYCL